jgi:hypothetical protein
MPRATEKMREAFEEIQMKRFFGFALLLVLSASPAFGSRKKPQTVIIPETFNRCHQSQLVALYPHCFYR